jgi:diacylglycerol kinase family enzyme/membrane-associated phospholipid phosphatase
VRQRPPLAGPLITSIPAADRKIMARIAATDSAVLDRVLPALSRAADHSALWLGVAGGLALTRNKRARRAALRGLAGIAIASTASNVIGKGLTRRVRPVDAAPLSRQLARGVRTTSFPSGHSASAAAFATGVALELPVLGVPVAVLAAAVGASRVVTGVHYPSDVLAGFATGVAAATLTTRWWPRRPRLPAATARPREQAPALATGRGLTLVLNHQSGHTSDDLAGWLAAELPDARILTAAAGPALPRLLAEAARDAAVLGIAGGDGSVRTAAAVAAGHGLPLLVIPAGTFNHFAADLGVRSRADAVTALRAGDCVRIDLAQAGELPFLNTASAGVYVDLVRAREQLEKKLGKWPAVVVALARVLRSSAPVTLTIDGQPRRLWLLFAGNCRYEPAGAAPSYRPDLADGELDLRVIDGQQPLARLRLTAAVATGTLARSRVYQAWTASSVRIAAADGQPLQLSVDGERVRLGSAATIGKHQRQLLAYRPDPAGRAEPAAKSHDPA